jgi:hypothetical protein
MSESETLSSDLKSSETLNSYLNTTIDGLTKNLESLNQMVLLMCGRIQNVSTRKIPADNAFSVVR